MLTSDKLESIQKYKRTEKNLLSKMYFPEIAFITILAYIPLMPCIAFQLVILVNINAFLNVTK